MESSIKTLKMTCNSILTGKCNRNNYILTENLIMVWLHAHSYMRSYINWIEYTHIKFL